MKKENMQNNNVTENSGNRKLPFIIGGVVAAVLVIAIIVIICITSSAKTQNLEVRVAAPLEPAPIAEETAEPKEQVKETPTEKVEEQIAEETKLNTLDDWISSLDLSEPQISIWNEETKKGLILNNGDSHELMDNEKLLMSYQQEWDAFNCKDEKRAIKKMPSGEHYTEFVLELNGTADFEIKLTIDGVEYERQFSITANNKPSAMEENKTFSTGAEWAESLSQSMTEPQIVIWNDELGTQIILEDGQEYQVCKGDLLAIAKIEGLTLKVSRPLIIARTAKSEKSYYSFDCNSIVEKTDFSVDFTFNGTEVTLKCTLLPPTE